VCVRVRACVRAYGYKKILHCLFYYRNSSNTESRDSSVGIATGYGLDDGTIGIRFPAGAGNSSLCHRVQTGSGSHPSSYPIGTWGSFPGGKAAGA
jgi:hypothetical protein